MFVNSFLQKIVAHVTDEVHVLFVSNLEILGNLFYLCFFVLFFVVFFFWRVGGVNSIHSHK